MITDIMLLTRGEMTGGATVVTVDLAKEMISIGRTPLIVHGCDSMGLTNECKRQGIRDMGVGFLSNGYDIKSDLRVIFLVRGLLREHRDARLVVSSTKAALLGRLAALLEGRKCVYIVHGWSYTGWQKKPVKLAFFALEYLMAIISRLHTFNIYVSKHDQRIRPWLGCLTTSFSRGLVIHNGVQDVGLARVGVRRSCNGLSVVSVCRLDKQKDVYSLIRAVSRISNVSLTVIGDGPEKAELEQLAKKECDEGQVTFLGRMSREALMKEMCRHDIFALISNWEGYPISTVEAMACGLPVIVSDVGGAGEVFQFGRRDIGRVIRSENSESEIAESICFYFDEEVRMRHGRNARAIFEKWGNKKEMMSKYKWVLEEVFGEK